MIKGVTYRNGDWYTMGSAFIYLDLKSEAQFPEYVERTNYWRTIFNEPIFEPFFSAIQHKLSTEVFNVPVEFLAECVSGGEKIPVGYPGFHIFPGHDTLVAFFGKKHKDRQWEALLKFPQIKRFFLGQEIKNHFSITIPLVLPFMGGGMLTGEKLDEMYWYREGKLVHAQRGL